MANQDQVTLRFESTIESENSDPILLSGPIQIFATAEFTDELSSQKLASEINNTSEAEVSQIIVFVKHIEDHENSQTHRGAYFLLLRERREERKEEYPFDTDWVEILLGTHSHINMDSLESLEGLSSEKGIVVSNGDSTFSLKSIPEFLGETGSYLPAFPKEVQEKIDRLKNIGMAEPTDSEWNHLDAELMELTDPYDWLSPDHINIAVGNCRELYRALVLADKKLYLTSDYGISTSSEGSIGWLNLAAYNVDYNITHEPDNESVVYCYRDDKNPTNRILLKLELPWNVLENDIILFFDESKLIETYKVVSRDGKEIILRLPAKEYSDREEPSALTVLVVRDCTEDEREVEYDIKEAIAEGHLSLESINRELTKLYMDGELRRMPNLPKLYLVTDEYGTIHWENKLLPQQYFYTKDITIKEGELNDYIVDGNVRLIFENAYLNFKDDFFPFLIIDGMLAGDNKQYISLKSGKDLIYDLPFSKGVYDFDPSKDHHITLVLVKNALGGSLADEIADKYISKKDAIAILSGGKIKLDDYATMDTLLDYSKKNHLHSQYSLKGHNHDYRYANFYHSHPEMLSAVAQLIVDYLGSGQDVEVVKAKLEELSEEDKKKYEVYLEYLLENAGFIIEKEEQDGEEKIKAIKYFDRSVLLSEDVIDGIDSIISENNANIPLMSSIRDADDNPCPTVQDALKALADLFRKDTVLDSQVLLEDDIAVRLVNGPIGGIIDSTKVYKAGTPIQQILRDILNPQISISDMRDILLPVAEYSKIIWYSGETKVEDPSRIPLELYQSGPIYFEYELRNKNNEPCEYEIHNKISGSYIQKPEIEVFIDGTPQELLANGKYLYSDQSFENLEAFPAITLSWDPNQKIKDNYGIPYIVEGSVLGTIGEDVSHIELEAPEFTPEYPDFYVGVLQNIDDIDTEGFIESRLTLQPSDRRYFHSGCEKKKFPRVSARAGEILTILVEEHELVNGKELTIFDNSIDITEYFEIRDDLITVSNSRYKAYTYETFVDQDFSILITVGKEK